MKVKLPLLIISLLMQSRSAAARVTDLGLSASLPLYLALLIACIATLVIAAKLSWSTGRWAFAVLAAGGTFVSSAFYSVMSEELSYDAFSNLWDARAFAGDAVGQFAGHFLWGAISSIVLLVAIGLAPSGQADRKRSGTDLIPLAALCALSVLLYHRGGEGARGLPGALIVPSYSLISAFENIGRASEARQPVRLRRTRQPVDRDIVLIIDESIAGQYLDINNREGVYSGLAQPRQNFAVHNFGLSSSVTNCSTGSNLTLRFGGTRQDYRRINATGPSIWAYAKNAGLGTVYIDAQRTGGSYQNGMNDAEREQIDAWIQFEDVAIIDRDQAVADTLASLLNDEHSQFILINKMGAHFPVQAKYPENRTRFRPAAARSQFHNIVEPSVRDTSTVGQQEWQLYRNAYRNVVEWNVGAFFDRLFAATDTSRATLIYTADHGQHFHEQGEPGNATHCTPEPAIEEGIVPLVVIEGRQPSGIDWQRAATRNRNKTSHFRIFPTLLGLMGYGSEGVARAYGARMDASTADRLSFNTNFNARLGREPAWQEINIEQVNTPPRDDYVSRND